MLQDKRICLKWIVESQQEHIKDKIQNLQAKAVFPGIEIINVDPKQSKKSELYEQCPVDTEDARCTKIKAQEQAQQQHAADFRSLCIAAEKGDLEGVKSLLHNNEVNPNQLSPDGATPLYIAAQKGDLAMVAIPELILIRNLMV